jgi:hypothetical protein
MNYILLWITQIVFSLFFVALIVAISSRCKKVRWQRLWPILSTILMFLSFAAITFIGGFLLFHGKQPKWLFWYGLSQAIAYLIGISVIFKKGLSKSGPGNQRALSWKRSQLTTAFGLFLIIHISIINILELKVMSNLKFIKTEAALNIINLLPSQLPTTLNAHYFYKKATDALPNQKDFPKWFFESYRPTVKLDFDEATKLLEKHQTALTFVKRAVTIPGYSLESYQAIPFEIILPNFIKYRNAAKLLALSARMKAHSGEFAGAMKDLAIIENMATHLRNYPSLISFIVAASMDEIRYVVLENVLSQTKDSLSSFVSGPIAHYPSVINSYSKALRFEAQYFLHLFTENMEKHNLVIYQRNKSLNNDVSILTKYFRIFILPNELRDAKSIIADTMSMSYDTFSELEKGMNSIIEMKNSGKMSAFTSNSVPNYLTYHRQAKKNDAIRGLTALAFAATVYKESNDQYPSRIEDLVPDFIDKIPSDPYDNHPLKIKHVDGGFDIYSTGISKELDKSKNGGPIHFYLGKNTYWEYRIKPGLEDKSKTLKQ